MTAPQDSFSTDRPARSGAQVFSILAIVFGVAAVLFLPIVLGPIGVILAFVGKQRGEPLWKVGLGVAIAGTVIGLVLGAVVLNAAD